MKDIVSYRRYLTRKCAGYHIPVSGTFELTSRCNFNCEMCYIHQDNEKKKELSTSQWIQLAKQLKEKGMQFLLLTGGEPLIRDDFKEIYEAIYKMGIFISINSNGSLWTKEMVDWISIMPPLQINITLYGSNENTYSSLCHNPSGFEEVRKNLLYMKEANLRVKINTTISKANKDDLKDLILFAKKYDFEFGGTTYLFPTVRKIENCKVERLNPIDAGKYKVFIEKKLFDQSNEECVVEDINNINEVNLEQCMSCSAGRSSFWITWEGNVLSCGMIPQYQYSLMDYSFDEIWDKLYNDVQEVHMPLRCKNCPYKNNCVICGAVALNEVDLHYVCEMMRSYDFTYKLMKGKG